MAQIKNRKKSMRPLEIAIFGNTNNYPLLLAQGLQKIGHNVRLILNRKEILHRPESRYPHWTGAYPSWVHDCSDMSDDDIAFKTPAINQAIHHLTRQVDLAILNDTGPAFATYLSCPHVALLTGSDLAYYANFDTVSLRSNVWAPEFKRSSSGRRHSLEFANFVARQRDGILSASVVCYAQKGLVPSGDQMLEQIGVSDSDRLMLYFSNTIDLDPREPPSNERLTILCGSRIVYRHDRNPCLGAIDFKGTDVLLKGFALYANSGGRGRLRLFRKGQDLDAAIDLVAALDIKDRVSWIDEMSMSSFYEEMAAADLICDQFGTSFPGMVTADAMALQRPVMANFKSEFFKQRFSEPLPGFDVRTPEEIAFQLTAIDKDRRLLTEMGRRSRIYAETQLSPQVMAKTLIEKLNMRCTQTDSYS
ncbi:glycosyltransferase family 4 protein [Roseibium sediminis]|uniref:glycosyltransferase family 4 protein n=1 Tax=Roseibium sediminis TaxID=1775174 RepID=UPI00137638A2|nr:glycosyltransferase family 4 protein [Roseibium sediminis]